MRKLTTFFTFIFILLAGAANAQVAVNENFDANGANLPLGWFQNEIIGNAGNGNDFTVVTTGTNPTCSPFSATRMVKYDSWAATTGDQAYLVSVPYDFSTRGAAIPTVSFRMFRSTNAGTDRLEVFVNTTPDLTGSPFQIGTANRNHTSNMWDLFTFNVTNPAFNTTTNYIIFKGITGSGINAGGSIYFDNLIVNTYPGNMAYVSSEAYQITYPMPQGAVNQQILKLEIITSGAANPCAVTALNLNTNGTTNVGEIANAKIYYTGASEEFQAINQFGATIFSPVGTNISFTGTRALANGKNYFWLTYSITGTAAIGNLFDGDWIDFTMNGNCSANPYTPSVQAPVGSRFIDYNYCTTNYSTGTTTSRYIDDVILPGEPGTGVLSNTNSCRATSSPWYTFYPPNSGYTTSLKQGETYTLTTRMGARTPFSASSSNSNNGHVQNAIVWIDFNRNGVFEGWERIYEGWYANGNKYMENGWSPTTVSPPSGGCAVRTTINPNAAVSGSFVVPNVGSAIAGPTRMRVRFVRYSRSTTTSPAPSNPGSANPLSPPNTTGATAGAFTSQHSPCGTYSGWIAYGEAEDYVVTITPPCSSGEWLGFTDDWDNPANWCDGVPTPTTNVIIPTVPVGGKMPTIFDGTLATCNNIIIHPSATVTIKSPKNGNWQIYGTLTNNGTIDIPTAFNNNFVIGSGTLTTLPGAFPSPFPGTNATDARSQMRYSASELLSNGFTAGDAISSIGLQLANMNNSNPFGPPAGQEIQNLSVTVGHTTNANNWVYAPPNNTSQNWFTFAGATSVHSAPAYTPVPNNTNLFALNTPFIWNGTDDILVEICFDNINNSTNRTDHYEVYYTQTTGVPSFKHTHYTVNSGVLNGCAIGSPANGTTGYNGNVLDRRPNLVVEAFSPNGIYPIYIRGDWVNNGTFNAGRSNVIFDGSASQYIDGSALSTFGRITVAKPGVVVMNRAADVDSSLYLNAGVLELNGNVLTLKNPFIQNPTVGTLGGFHALSTVPAWARNTGFVRAETMPPANIGYLQWNIGNVVTAASYVFPFGGGAAGTGATVANYVPVDIDYNAGVDLGNLKVSTYGTPPNNLTLPPGVGHINGFASPNDAYMIDRYWLMEKTGPASAGAGFKLRWRTASETAIPPDYFAQRWYTTGWPAPGVGFGTAGSGVVTVTVADLSSYTPAGGWGTTNVWALSGTATPLPIELLSFDANLRGDEVHLKWTTATEKDNDFFTIEKTRDAREFIFVEKVRSLVGTSNTPTDYFTIDKDPLRGISYYRLGQTDFDGTTTFSDLVPIDYNYSVFDIVSTAGAESNLIVAFGYDSEEPVNYIITDMLGRVMAKKENNNTVEGTNVLNIDATGWKEGVYFITLYNSQKSISRKIFYSVP